MTPETLQAAMPGLSLTLARAYQPLNDAAMNEFGINNLNRAQHWLAQVGHESVSLRYFEEIASGAAYEGRQDLGNTQKGDGVRFKGRGPIQVTGRYNYTKAAAALRLDLVGNPALAAQPQHAFRISAWWWWQAGCNGLADGGPGAVTALTRRINGGTNGLADRQSRYNRVLTLGNAVLPASGAAPAPSTPQTPPKPQGGAVAIVRTNTGNGYYIFGSDGGVFCFGDAIFCGSIPGLRPPVTLAAPIVSAALTPSGKGYLLAASDGGLFCFGDARFYGSMGGKKLAAPIVDIQVHPSGGYWMLGKDGGVFAFNAPFAGAATGKVVL